MKNLTIILVLFSTTISFSQIPVTDAATNASIGMVNSQLTNISIQLKTVNKNLSRLINLMEKNNNNNRKAKEILKEELEAKKEAPDYVVKSIDVEKTVDLKEKILKAYNTTKNSIRQLKYLENDETQEFISYAAKAIVETKKLFGQCNEILKTKAIILPEERLKKVNGINTKLEGILDGLIDHNEKLSQLNAFRKARLSLIDMNKDQ